MRGDFPVGYSPRQRARLPLVCLDGHTQSGPILWILQTPLCFRNSESLDFGTSWPANLQIRDFWISDSDLLSFWVWFSELLMKLPTNFWNFRISDIPEVFKELVGFQLIGATQNIPSDREVTITMAGWNIAPERESLQTLFLGVSIRNQIFACKLRTLRGIGYTSEDINPPSVYYTLYKRASKHMRLKQYPHPHWNDCINNSLRMILCNSRDLIT